MTPAVADHRALAYVHWITLYAASNQSLVNIPTLLPVETIPFASMILVVKYWEVTTTLGRYRNPDPRPTQTPWDKSICQYSVANDAATKPQTWRNIPIHSWVCRYPLSRSPPQRIPTNINRNIWLEPIHEIAEGDTPSEDCSEP
jgi:hypothetical protein